MIKITIEVPRRTKVILLIVIFFCAALTAVAVLAFLQNIKQRKEEAKQYVFKIVELTEDTIDPFEWGKNFPRQYDGYKRTTDIERTKHGGSEAFDKLEADPRWRMLFAGYSFSIDYREERGHAYMLSDQETSLRVKNFNQPGACLHCHASVVSAYRQKGREAGIAINDPTEQIQKGFELVCAMPYDQARRLVSHPVSCVDCHDPTTMQLRVTRPAFIYGIAVLAESEDPLPQYPSIEQWRKGSREKTYNANKLASRQEMRTFACAQCHVEYYFKGEGKLLTYPWQNGLKAQQELAYYNNIAHKDWTYPDSNSPLLKAQHPEFELWSQGVHSRSGVACADCHMPYKREGAIKISDHHIRSPMLNINRACQTCHPISESEIKELVEKIQDKTADLLSKAEDAVLDLILAIEEAQAVGATDAQLYESLKFHREAQWYIDYISAENSLGFHAPQESARILAEAVDAARKGTWAAMNFIPYDEP